MDPKDLELLRVLAGNGRLREDAISSVLGISVDNVQRRMRLLLRDGVITGFSAFFDRRMFGYDTALLKLHYKGGQMERIMDEASQLPGVVMLYPNLDDFIFVEVVHYDSKDLDSTIKALERIASPSTVSAHLVPLLPETVPERPKGLDLKLLQELVLEGRADEPSLAQRAGSTEEKVLKHLSSMEQGGVFKVLPIVQEDEVQPFPTYSIIVTLKEGCEINGCYNDLSKLSRDAWYSFPLERPQGIWFKCFGRDLYAMDDMLERFRRLPYVKETLVVLPGPMRTMRAFDASLLGETKKTRRSRSPA